MFYAHFGYFYKIKKELSKTILNNILFNNFQKKINHLKQVVFMHILTFLI